MRYSSRLLLVGTLVVFGVSFGGALASETTGTLSQPGSVTTGISGTVARPVPTPTPTPTPAPSGGGGGGVGGGGSIIIFTPTPSPTGTSALVSRIDSNRDGRIDILDFNTLMVNWGRSGAGNIADFDLNGVVDIFDFNLMMVHWTR